MCVQLQYYWFGNAKLHIEDVSGYSTYVDTNNPLTQFSPNELQCYSLESIYYYVHYQAAKKIQNY